MPTGATWQSRTPLDARLDLRTCDERCRLGRPCARALYTLAEQRAAVAVLQHGRRHGLRLQLQLHIPSPLCDCCSPLASECGHSVSPPKVR